MGFAGHPRIADNFNQFLEKLNTLFTFIFSLPNILGLQ
jgi:hypothetical protein